MPTPTPSQAKGQPQAADPTLPGAPSAKILVIDDEVAVLRLLKTLLARSNYEVTTAETAREALAMIESGRFDCVITDAVMPEMSGYDFVKTVRSNPRHAELPVLMLTRKRHRQDVKKAVEAGVTDYVLKPIDENLLIEKVELCLKKGGTPCLPEVPLQGSDSSAEVAVGCQIVSLSETTLTLRLPFKLEERVPLQLRCRIFAEIGIDQPLLKIHRCEKIADDDPHSEYPWEAKASFTHTPETDLHKVRSWLQKHSEQQHE